MKNNLKMAEPGLCFTCHASIRAEVNKQSHHPLKEGLMKCTQCHDPHGGSGPKMVRADTINELCFQCPPKSAGHICGNIRRLPKIVLLAMCLTAAIMESFCLRNSGRGAGGDEEESGGRNPRERDQSFGGTHGFLPGLCFPPMRVHRNYAAHRLPGRTGRAVSSLAPISVSERHFGSTAGPIGSRPSLGRRSPIARDHTQRPNGGQEDPQEGGRGDRGADQDRRPDGQE